MLVFVSKYRYFVIYLINWYHACQIMIFFQFEFFEEYDIAKLILNHNLNSKHQKSTFVLVFVSKYRYFVLSHFTWYHVCQNIEFFKFNFFEEYDIAKLIFNHNLKSKQQKNNFCASLCVDISLFCNISYQLISCLPEYEIFQIRFFWWIWGCKNDFQP